MIAYKYDQDTKEYVGIVECQIDPLESEIRRENIYLLPANSTYIIPPEIKENETIIFENNSWKIEKDYRGKKYWLPEDNWLSLGHTVNDIGDIPENASFVKPEKSLDDYKEEKLSNIKISRNNEELSPIEYMGYYWDFDYDAQQRINGAINALEKEDYLTWTSANDEEIEEVTAEILKNVIKVAAIRSNLIHIKYRELKTKILNSKSPEELEKISW